MWIIFKIKFEVLNYVLYFQQAQQRQIGFMWMLFPGWPVKHSWAHGVVLRMLVSWTWLLVPKQSHHHDHYHCSLFFFHDETHFFSHYHYTCILFSFIIICFTFSKVFLFFFLVERLFFIFISLLFCVFFFIQLPLCIFYKNP